MKVINSDWDAKLEEARADAAKLVNILKCEDAGLPEDLDFPETVAQVNAVRALAGDAYDIACDLMVHSEALMVSEECQENLDEFLLERDGPGEFEGHKIGR